MLQLVESRRLKINWKLRFFVHLSNHSRIGNKFITKLEKKNVADRNTEFLSVFACYKQGFFVTNCEKWTFKLQNIADHSTSTFRHKWRKVNFFTETRKFVLTSVLTKRIREGQSSSWATNDVFRAGRSKEIFATEWLFLFWHRVAYCRWQFYFLSLSWEITFYATKHPYVRKMRILDA